MHNEKNKKCSYRECGECQNIQLPKSFTEKEAGRQVNWYVWKTRKVRIPKSIRKNEKDEIKQVSITSKEKEYGTLKTLYEDFKADIQKLGRHAFNIGNQYKQIRQLKDKLLPSEVIIHADYSENYIAKYSEEIQSVHFGASQKQISLHTRTGILYFADKEHASFCSISDATYHGPAAVWAHLEPVLELAKRMVPELETVHFITDGPTTQYRNKDNLYLLTTELNIQIGLRKSDMELFRGRPWKRCSRRYWCGN